MDVEQYDVRPGGEDDVNCRVRISGLSDNGDGAADLSLDSGTEHRMVIHHDHPGRTPRAPFSWPYRLVGRARLRWGCSWCAHSVISSRTSVPSRAGTDAGLATMPLHPVEDAALDAHPVLAYPVEIETLTAIANKDLDPVIVDLGVNIDLVRSRVLGSA